MSFQTKQYSLFDAAPHAIFVIDKDFHLCELNPAAQRLMAGSEEILVGRSLIDLLLPLRAQASFQEEIAQVPSSEAATNATDANRNYRIRTTALRSGETEFPAELTIVHGVFGHADWFTIHVTELSAPEPDLEELIAYAEAARNDYRMLADFIPQQVWTALPNGQLNYVNRRAAEYFGQTPEALLGAGWLSVVHPDDTASCVKAWVESLSTGNPYQVEFRLLCAAESTYRWHLGRAISMRDEAGVVTQWLGTNTDIDDWKQVERELLAAKVAADQASLAKSQFLANMSHELRTPLNAIIGYGEMVQEEAESAGLANIAPDLARINTAGRHLLSLIQDVLDLSKIEAGKMELLLERFDVNALLAEVLTTARPLVGRNGNRLEAAVDADLGTMYADASKLRQCLMNLLSNAAKFTNHGTVTLEALRQDKPSPGEIVFSVADSGIGMTPAQMRELFQPFHQGDAEISRDYGGTGLGLALSRSFCRMMGGSVDAVSQAGKGSVFTMRIPLR